MTVVFVNRYFYPDHSATSQLVSDLAFHLAERGHQVRVVTSRQRYDAPDARLPPREQIRGVDVHRVWTFRFGRASLPGRALDYLSFYLSAGWRLLRLARSGDLVVAKTDPPLISIVAGWAARWRGAHLVNWLQDLFPEVAAALGIGLAKGRTGRALVALRNASLRRAVLNVAIGDGMRVRLLGLGVDRDRLQVIHNWCDDAHIGPLPSASNPLRKRWGLADRFVVGYSGNLGRAHEIDTLLAAAERLGHDAGIVFLFIGGGAALERLRFEAEARGLANLCFQPYQPYELLPESLSVPDVHLVILRPELEGLIVPSKFYGIAAAGRPTIHVGAMDGEIPRLLRKAEAGLAVARGDGEGLALAILRLRDDAALRERMGHNARLLCEARFSRRAALERWEAVLGSAMTS